MAFRVEWKKSTRKDLRKHTEEKRIPALQGRKRIAQGNTLGERGAFVKSPVRATQNHWTTCSGRNPHSVSPFQGFYFCSSFPQGVSLGSLIPPPWGGVCRRQ